MHHPKPTEPEIAVTAKTQEKDDVLGILSLVASLSGFAVVGLVLGLVGVSKAKKEGRSPALARTGWIMGLVFTIIGLLIFIVILAAVPTLQRNVRETKARNDAALNESRINQSQSEPTQAY